MGISAQKFIATGLPYASAVELERQISAGADVAKLVGIGFPPVQALEMGRQIAAAQGVADYLIGVGVLTPLAAEIAIAINGGPAPVPAPVNIVLPAISGTATQGQPLTASQGTWTNAPTGYAFQWKADGVNIVGATASTYLLTASEVGKTITVLVAASNAGGSNAVTSAGAGPVAGLGPSAVILPTPPFGGANLRAWFDVGKTFKNSAGVDTPSIYYDTLGYDSVAAWEDISGNGYLLNTPDKTMQPTKGPLGGPLFDSAAVYLDFYRKNLFNGLSALSVFASVRPILNGGAAKRTLIYGSEGNTSAVAMAVAVAAGGSGYAVGDKVVLTGGTFSTAVTIVVQAVSGGAITQAAIANPGAYTVIPSNPVAQGSTTLYGSSTAGAGTGATFNMTFSTIGSGSAAERMSFYMSQGSTGRKPYITLSPGDGTAASTSTSVSQSVGPANGGALSDTTTRRRVGYVIDTTAGTLQQYYEGAADGAAQSIATGAFGTGDSIILRVGNNNAPNSPLYMELVRLIVLAEVPDASRLAAIDSYLGSAL